MVTPHKQRILAKLLSTLGKKYDDKPPPDQSVLDHLLLAVLQEGTSLPVAIQAHRRLLSGFHDLNELRVSHPSELIEHLDGVTDKETKSRRILAILKFVFETTYAFDLESMRKKPIKQAQKQLSKITGASPFAVAAVVQRALGGHALPIDERMHEILFRLELLDDLEPSDEARGGLEHLIPKAKGPSFCILLGELAADTRGQEEVLLSIHPKLKPKRAAAAPEPSRPAAGSRATGTGAATGSKSPGGHVGANPGGAAHKGPRAAKPSPSGKNPKAPSGRKPGPKDKSN